MENFRREDKYALFLESVLPAHNIGDAFITNDAKFQRNSQSMAFIVK